MTRKFQAEQDNRPAKIAGVILCLNEAENLRRALTSLSWCDERIVIDSGSTDESRTIAEELGAKVYVHRQQGPFLITDQRNWAITNTGIKSEWILFLDADEEIGAQCQSAIQSAINSKKAPIAFNMTPRYWFLGRWLKHTQNYPNWHPRLLQKGKIEFQGGVWETFSRDANIGNIGSPYEHYAFSKGMDDWLVRHQRYASWEAKSLYEYQESERVEALRTNRALQKRVIMARLWQFRPLLRFLEKYFFNMGFLEGWQGMLYSLMMAFYELMIVVKLIEIRRRQRGEQL